MPLLVFPAGATDAAPSTSSSSSFVNGATSKNLPAVQSVAPMPEDTVENMRYNRARSLHPCSYVHNCVIYL